MIYLYWKDEVLEVYVVELVLNINILKLEVSIKSLKWKKIKK